MSLSIPKLRAHICEITASRFLTNVSKLSQRGDFSNEKRRFRVFNNPLTLPLTSLTSGLRIRRKPGGGPHRPRAAKPSQGHAPQSGHRPVQPRAAAHPDRPRPPGAGLRPSCPHLPIHFSHGGGSIPKPSLVTNLVLCNKFTTAMGPTSLASVNRWGRWTLEAGKGDPAELVTFYEERRHQSRGIALAVPRATCVPATAAELLCLGR